MKLLNENVLTQKGDINADAMELKGNDRFGDNRNYQKYSSKEHVGSAIVTENVTGTVGNINLRGSAFIAENGDKLNIGNVKVESAVNEYDTESRSRSFQAERAIQKAIRKKMPLKRFMQMEVLPMWMKYITIQGQ